MDSTSANRTRAAHDHSAERGPGETVAVMLPLPLADPYDYKVPADLRLAAGDIVRVPLGPREINGVVWGAGTGKVAALRLREVRARLDVPPLSGAQQKFLEWVANYTLTPRGSVLRLTLSVPAALTPPPARQGYVPGGTLPARMTEARKRVLHVAAAAQAPLAASDLARASDVTASVVRGLADAGALVPAMLPARRTFRAPDPERTGVSLSPLQEDAANGLRAQVREDRFSVTLLDGVTGSGKTEVYLEAVAHSLRQGRQAVVLVPEIALTAQWLERFRHRFGATPAEWHSDLGKAERRETWRAVAEGHARAVVGARSALFLPYADLGLIVVDEEHDASYKQEEGVIYNARDMAVALGRTADIPVVLVSATPALETLVNTRAGRYGRLHLVDRHGGAELPRIDAVDLRRDPPEPGRWLAPPVIAAMAAALDDGKQSMLFLNRRGYAPLTLCRACGHRLECPNCQAWLVEHRFVGRLECHHCGQAMPIPRTCPSCGAEDSLVTCGPGVERIAEEVRERFPPARAAVMASDTVAGPKAAAELVQSVTDGAVDVLIGTQIVAKGHHFPLLTVVAVVDADLGLAGGDLRAAERTYQLLSQVSGRAGRAEHPGRVFLQTHCPEHPVMTALLSGDRDAFLVREEEDRRARGLPPFGRLVALIVSGVDAGAVERTARALGLAAPHAAGVRVLGPAPAPLAMLRGRYRHRLLVKATRETNVQAYVRRWLGKVPVPSGLRVQIDVDPYSFV